MAVLALYVFLVLNFYSFLRVNFKKFLKNKFSFLTIRKNDVSIFLLNLNYLVLGVLTFKF